MTFHAASLISAHATLRPEEEEEEEEEAEILHL
jgi:hypothetical protein